MKTEPFRTAAALIIISYQLVTLKNSKLGVMREISAVPCNCMLICAHLLPTLGGSAVKFKPRSIMTTRVRLANPSYG